MTVLLSAVWHFCYIFPETWKEDPTTFAIQGFPVSTHIYYIPGTIKTEVGRHSGGESHLYTLKFAHTEIQQVLRISGPISI